jgi:hypothetical protein
VFRSLPNGPHPACLRSPMNRRGRLLCAALASLAGDASCASYHPPFTHPSNVAAPTDPRDATLVFLWPLSSCDPGGYYTLASTDGRFIGTVSEGTQLRVVVPAGDCTVIGWDELEEQASGGVADRTVPLVRASLSAGYTYYVRMVFGEWDDPRPANAQSTRTTQRKCFAPGLNMTSAMAAVRPTSTVWTLLSDWTIGLQRIDADHAAGQVWLDEHRDVFEYHRTVATRRFEALGAEGQRMATVNVDDGVPARR